MGQDSILILHVALLIFLDTQNAGCHHKVEGP